jgi:hypothetical protein
MGGPLAHRTRPESEDREKEVRLLSVQSSTVNLERRLV